MSRFAGKAPVRNPTSCGVVMSANRKVAAVLSSLGLCGWSIAATTVFFDSSQTATLVTSGVTSDTISSNGYLFTVTRDKLFTGGTGQIIGRSVRIPWPVGLEAQAVTTPPPGITDYKARMTLRRVDGGLFDLQSFSLRLLANTGGAGAALEIMPLVDGEDAFSDPVQFDVTGYYGATFSYDTSPNHLGSTALLTGFDTYKVSLYVDFAFVALRFESPVVAADLDRDGDVDLDDFAILSSCLLGPESPAVGSCVSADLDFDGDVDIADFASYQRCYSGQDVAGDPSCS